MSNPCKRNRIMFCGSAMVMVRPSCATCLVYCILFFLVSSILSEKALAQSLDTLQFPEPIAVIGRPSIDSITLRWAPLTLSAWQEGNRLGYNIERYVMARDGKVLRQPEKTILTSSPIKPLAEEQWESLVIKNKFSAIAAQAVYGNQFEVDLRQGDVFSIVDKVKENEQRFTFALFSADMSPVTAQALGLWFTDRTVKRGEKYLYRIIVDIATDSLRGSIFISPDDHYFLPIPQNLKADFEGQLVSLQWDKSIVGKYTAHIVERSADGKTFSAISDIPLVTTTHTKQENSRYEYAIDSLPDISKSWYYRVRGITPFGELGPPSDSVSGWGSVAVNNAPYITDATNVENTLIRLKWEFPQESNVGIRGFSVERSSKPNKDFVAVTKGILPPLARVFEDHAPLQVSYYRIVAFTEINEQIVSPSYLAQLVDSIPPRVPTGLEANIDESGIVVLSWTANTEEDIYGYRVYKSNFSNEELKQITDEPIDNPIFTDRVNVNTLNKSVYYSISAIDRNQNRSPLSQLLMVSLPDKVKPQPPVFLPVKTGSKGVELSWIRSSSEDVTRYDLYRNSGEKEWQRVKMIEATTDTVYVFVDEYAKSGKIGSYTLIAVDKYGLESEPANAVKSYKIDNNLKQSIKWNEPIVIKERHQVKLSWNYESDGVQYYRIYKSVNGSDPVVYKSISGDMLEFHDKLDEGNNCKYMILVIFKDGTKSNLSKDIIIDY